MAEGSEQSLGQTRRVALRRGWSCNRESAGTAYKYSHNAKLGAQGSTKKTHPKDLILVLVVHHTQQGCKAISSHIEESILLCWIGL